MEGSRINQRVQPKNKGSKKLFQNKWIERLSRTHIAVPVCSLLLYATGMLLWAVYKTEVPSPQIVALYFIGFFVFSLTEYLLHRFLYHMKTNTELKKKIQYTMHGVHHEFPKDKERLALPPVISITVATLLLLIFKLIIGDYTFGFLSGFITGYALYLSMHYIMHAFPPPKNRLKILWVFHSIHHYKDESVYFGVSSPLWDYVFGTRYK